MRLILYRALWSEGENTSQLPWVACDVACSLSMVADVYEFELLGKIPGVSGLRAFLFEGSQGLAKVPDVCPGKRLCLGMDGDCLRRACCMEERSGVCSCSVIGCPKASLQTFVFDDLASSTTGNGARSCIISRCLSVCP